MHIINLRKHYPHYTEDIFLEVSDEVYEVILHSIRQENNYTSRKYYHKAQYSLDCGDGIENDALHRMPSPEEIFMQKVSLEQLYQALHALPSVQARRIYERYINQKKNVEIARAEGVHEASTRQSIIRGIENLRKYYAKRSLNIPLPFLLLSMACPKALKSYFTLSCFIFSPYYILPFIFLFWI